MTRSPDSPSPLRGVLFDAAGTLVRLSVPVGEVYAGWARAGGVDVQPGLLEAAFPGAWAGAAARRRAGESELSDEGVFWREVVRLTFLGAGQRVPDLPFGPLWEAFSGGDAWEPFDEVREVLPRLAGMGLRLGVVSNFDRRLHRILADTGLAPYFEAVVVSAEAGAEKPDPAIFHRGARALGLEPAEVIHVGDSPEDDYRGALAAGLGAVLVDREGVHGVPGSLADLRGIVTLLEGGDGR